MRELDGIGALLAGPANVVMQLSLPPVGHGVVESTVESGQLTRHPVKRLRTTFTYLAVAMLGSDEERDLYRAAVNRAHAAVHSGPDSQVAYDAFDPELQKWVAACLYFGAVDVHARLHRPMSDAEADAFYLEAARLATTLQVRPEEWPADRAAFDQYWDDTLSRISIDDTVREYLLGVIQLRFLPPAVRFLPAALSQFVTRGFLPPPFRTLMCLSWSTADQGRFDLMIGAIARVNRLLPPVARELPFHACLWDMRRRVRGGHRLV
ncbi:MAG: DUF2236 domain-containing protein [Acidimicrobiales bacterium]|nr:DUF2236 domain-containing protein [Acidimicrobiales bacterium]